MNDSDKDWHACAVYCVNRHAEALETGQPVQKAGPYTWQLRALAASLHHGGEGWAWIRKTLPELTDTSMLWLKDWTC